MLVSLAGLGHDGLYLATSVVTLGADARAVNVRAPSKAVMSGQNA